MIIIIVIIGVLAVGIGILAFILVRMFVAPKKVEALENRSKPWKTCLKPVKPKRPSKPRK